MDNTWATPLFFRAFDNGVDLSIQAGTKYIGGHSDIMLGHRLGERTLLARAEGDRRHDGVCARAR